MVALQLFSVVHSRRRSIAKARMLCHSKAKRSVILGLLGGVMSYRFNRGFDPMSQFQRASAVKTLIIINSVIFVITLLVRLNPAAASFFNTTFGLLPEYITTRFYIWQFLTAMFLHGNFFHLFFNMLGLFFFGPELEWLWGKRRFVSVYMVIGLLANLFSYLLGVHSQTITIGASGAVLGVVGAYAALYPNREVLFFFIPVKIKYLVLFLYLIPSFLGATGLEGGGGVAHVVHIAGILLGIAYVKVKFRALDDLLYSIKEKIRIWRIGRKYRKFKVVDGDVKRMWDDLEDKINDDKRPIN
jgi:membrane associated rhomboid family serine protease